MWKMKFNASYLNQTQRLATVLAIRTMTDRSEKTAIWQKGKEVVHNRPEVDRAPRVAESTDLLLKTTK